MKKRNIFSWNLLQTISVISPPSPATPPIRGRYKSGAVPAYLDSQGTPAYWSLTVHTAVEKSRYRGGWWRRGNDAGHCCASVQVCAGHSCARPDQPPINCALVAFLQFFGATGRKNCAAVWMDFVVGTSVSFCKGKRSHSSQFNLSRMFTPMFTPMVTPMFTTMFSVHNNVHTNVHNNVHSNVHTNAVQLHCVFVCSSVLLCTLVCSSVL